MVDSVLILFLVELVGAVGLICGGLYLGRITQTPRSRVPWSLRIVLAAASLLFSGLVTTVAVFVYFANT